MSHFKEALRFVLRMEGGFVDDPADHGGATNMGITQAVYDRYRDAMGGGQQSVERITGGEVEWIYYHWYWNASKCDKIAEINPRLAIAHMDWAVNTGPARAARHLQESLLNVTADGIIGPVTLAEIRRWESDVLIPKYLLKRLSFYASICKRDPTQRKFMWIWAWRVSELAEVISILP